MGMPAGVGVSVLFVLADQWRRDRRMLSRLGEEDPTELDDLVKRRPAPTDRVSRVALAAQLGGEVIRDSRP
jgi:hypothetical protein